MSAARGVSTSTYVSAGNTAADAAIGAIRAARRNSPNMGEIVMEGQKQRAQTKATALKAEADIHNAGIRKEAAVRKARVQADLDKSLAKSKTTVRKAGKIAAAGTLIGDNITEGHKAAREKAFREQLQAKEAARDQKWYDFWRSKRDTASDEVEALDKPEPTSDTPSDTPSSTATSIPDGDFNSSTMLTYLTGKGLSDIHAKGLVVNAIRESGLNPTVGGGDVGLSDGLFQWYKERRNKMKSSLGEDWGNPYKQLDYLWQEDKNLSIVGMDDYQAQDFKSVQESSDWFMRKWERPADPNRDSLKHTNLIKQQGWG